MSEDTEVTIEDVRKAIGPEPRIQLRYYHAGNDPLAVMRSTELYGTPRDYACYAYITVRDGETTTAVYSARSICAPDDVPVKKVARSLALSRVLNAYLMDTNDG